MQVAENAAGRWVARTGLGLGGRGRLGKGMDRRRRQLVGEARQRHSPRRGFGRQQVIGQRRTRADCGQECQ
jgi:hypothetical protein